MKVLQKTCNNYYPYKNSYQNILNYIGRLYNPKQNILRMLFGNISYIKLVVDQASRQLF